MNGTCKGTIFGVSASWGLGEGPKGQISLNLNYKVIFEDFSTKLCVFSQMKDIKHIRIFIRSPASCMPQGLGLGGARG